MEFTDSFSSEVFRQGDSFGFIKPEEFESLGIIPSDVLPGTFPACKHPAQLSSRFGGNAYGFGLFEIHDRLSSEDIKLLQSISLANPEDTKQHYHKLNEIYKSIGLLTRFSRLGSPYYLIPVHLASNTVTHINSKVAEISKIVGFHRKKYLKEYHDIGLITHQDDLIIGELTLHFKEHRFVVLSSLEKLKSQQQPLDLMILTRDLYEIALMKEFSSLSEQKFSKNRLDKYAIYILWTIYKALKPDGEIFIIANHYIPKTNQTTKLTFKTEQEGKNFALFTHIFRTKKKYSIQEQPLQVNTFDLQNYLTGLYVEQEVVDRLLDGKSLEELTLEQADNLPYFNFHLAGRIYLSDQVKNWSRLLGIPFEGIFLKPLLPQTVSEDWEKRFSFTDYTPGYMLIYLGQKKPLQTTVVEVSREVMRSKLIGCPTHLLADYRDSFEYVIRTLLVLDKLKKGAYSGLPQIFIERLKQPMENRNRRFRALNDVIKLMSKIKRLKEIKDYLNPDQIDGSETKVLKNLEILSFFGLNHREIREILYIVLGHTPLGRIISGKMNEKALKPVTDLARTYSPQQALNLLRYCRLMTVAETEAAKGSELTQEQLAMLFDLYEATVRVVTNRELDWDALLEERIESIGGVHRKIIRKLLMMMNHFEFLDNWSELMQMGRMEKESVADYDDHMLSRIENAIRLANTFNEFVKVFPESLQLAIFYRKFLYSKFYGTGRIFEWIDSENVYKLLWIMINVSQGEIINFNPILADIEIGQVDERIKRLEKEARGINVNHIDFAILKQFSEQLYQDKSSFIVGTGFQLRINEQTDALEISYIDIELKIEQLKILSKQLAGCRISEISVNDLECLEGLFSSLESFCQSHLRLLDHTMKGIKLPSRQKQWFNEIQDLENYLQASFLKVFFRPEDIYTDLNLLYHHTPSFLNFILPEFMALENLDLSWQLYLSSPVTHYILNAAKKFEALVKHDQDSFHDISFFHRLALKEFGPMATGIVGVSESQIVLLEKIIDDLKHNRSLFDALIKSFIFQDIGRIPHLRAKYEKEINPADIGHAGAFFVEKEKIAERYGLDEKGKRYLVFLVKHHSLLHHIIRGELSFYAIQGVLDTMDQELFDAFFVLSFVMICAIREDLIVEDLADRLFRIRELCHTIINNETTLEAQRNDDFIRSGLLSCALETYKDKGLSEGVSPEDYLELENTEGFDDSKCIQAGRMIFTLERILRLRGIKYVGFLDLVKLMLKIPLQFIYKKRRFSSIGYATFEKELYEAYRIYNTLQNLPEETRHFILNQFVDIKVRIFGYEKISGYLSYKNQIKLLFIGLLGTKKFKPNGAPICLNFLDLSKKIERRYESVNEHLNTISIEKLWGDSKHLNQLFRSKTGVILKREKFTNVLSLDFYDPAGVSKKISYMNTINDVEQLKNYFHYSLRSLRKISFYTEDYERQLEKAFEKRRTAITDMILNQTKKQMDLIKDFGEIHNLVTNLTERSWEIGFSDDQKNRINDLYELRKDSLKRKKLIEIEAVLSTVYDSHELKDYWNSIKWYLKENRGFFGKGFEKLISKKFDTALSSLEPPFSNGHQPDKPS